MEDEDRCPECGSWDRECGSPIPVDGCGCARCLNSALADAKTSRDFYKRRCEMLQEAQHRMRDPERVLVCDILANGALLPDPNGKRYPTAPDKTIEQLTETLRVLSGGPDNNGKTHGAELHDVIAMHRYAKEAMMKCGIE